MGELDFGGDRRRGRGSLGVNLRRPIVTNGDFVASLCGSAYSDRAVVWRDECGGPRHSCGYRQPSYSQQCCNGILPYRQCLESFCTHYSTTLVPQYMHHAVTEHTSLLLSVYLPSQTLYAYEVS